MLPQDRDRGGEAQHNRFSGNALEPASTSERISRGGVLDDELAELFDDSDLDIAAPKSNATPLSHPLARDANTTSSATPAAQSPAGTDSPNQPRDPLLSLFGDIAAEDKDVEMTTRHVTSNGSIPTSPVPLAGEAKESRHDSSLGVETSQTPRYASTREPSLLVAAREKQLKLASEAKAAQKNSDAKNSEDGSSSNSGSSGDVILVDEHGRPIGKPMKTLQVMIIAYVAFVNILASVIIFPFLPFFAAMFYPDVPTSRMGVYIGMLASAYFLGDVIGSLIWGRFADTYGRKPAVLIGLLTSLSGLMFFPFSPQYWVAVVVRFLSGLLCGNNSLTRTMIAELCDDSNQHRGFSMIGLATGMARLVAPAIGGFLALPAQKYPRIFKDTIFETFPYFLPCFIGAVLTFICILLVMFYVDETLPPKPVPRSNPNEQEMVEKRSGQVGQQEKKAEESKEQNLLDVVTEPAVLNILVVYFIHSFVGVISHEIIPMWVVNKKEDHGFEFDTNQIGTLATLVSPFQVLFQGYVYPVLAERWLYIRLFKYCAIVYGIALFCLPYVSLLAYSPAYILWPSFICVQGIAVCARIGAFTCIFALLSNSCDKSVRASINGIGQSVSSAGRMLGPTVAGAIFSWSLNNGLGYPFNYHCLFLLLTICCGLTYFSAMYMHPELDYQKHTAKQLLAERLKAEAAKARAQLTGVSDYKPAGKRLVRVVVGDKAADDDDDDSEDAGQSLLSRPKIR